LFTGLVERTGIVSSMTALSSESSTFELIVDPGTDYAREKGDSIAVDGVCLSHVDTNKEGLLKFHVSSETLSKTNLLDIKIGTLVNLERAMRLQDRLGGHMVLGHVDGVAHVQSVQSSGPCYELKITLPRSLCRYVVSKGSICLSGISLTVNHLEDTTPDQSTLTFMIIPVTWSTTNLHQLPTRNTLNVEVDILAKHIERLMN
jgi:riboflavin synthase